jgi:hypothetical protein
MEFIVVNRRKIVELRPKNPRTRTAATGNEKSIDKKKRHETNLATRAGDKTPHALP